MTCAHCKLSIVLDSWLNMIHMRACGCYGQYAFSTMIKDIESGKVPVIEYLTPVERVFYEV